MTTVVQYFAVNFYIFQYYRSTPFILHFYSGLVLFSNWHPASSVDFICYREGAVGKDVSRWDSCFYFILFFMAHVAI